MANQYLKFLMSRETTYEFSNKQVAKSRIIEILDSARWAPSCLNSQPWRFIVTQKQKAIKDLFKLCFYGNLSSYPTAVVAIAFDQEISFTDKFYLDMEKKFIPYIDYMNIAMPALMMTYSAQALGISSCIKAPISHEANKILKVAHSLPIMLLVGLGYSKNSKVKRLRERKDMSKLVEFKN